MARGFDNNFDVKAYLSGERSLERARESARAVSDMNATLRKMDILLTAMWGVVKEVGITPEDLDKRIDEIINGDMSLLSGRGKGICAKCGKQVSESSKTPFRGQCMYCGEVVTFYPDLNAEGSVDEPLPEKTENDAEQTSYDPDQPIIGPDDYL